MKTLPKARNENIIMQDAGDEILIYDTTTNNAYCLNEISAKVFNACDGEQTFAELKSQYQLTDEIIFLALDALKARNLLDSSANYETPFAGMTRREAVRKVGLATMVALPLITGIVAPKVANAASAGGGTVPNGQTCASTAQCATGNRCTTTNNGTQRCCSTGNTVQSQERGTDLGNTSRSNCDNILGPQFCCSGSASYGILRAQSCVCN